MHVHRYSCARKYLYLEKSWFIIHYLLCVCSNSTYSGTYSIVFLLPYSYITILAVLLCGVLLLIMYMFETTKLICAINQNQSIPQRMPEALFWILSSEITVLNYCHLSQWETKLTNSLRPEEIAVIYVINHTSACINQPSQNQFRSCLCAEWQQIMARIIIYYWPDIY